MGPMRIIRSPKRDVATEMEGAKQDLATTPPAEHTDCVRQSAFRHATVVACRNSFPSVADSGCSIFICLPGSRWLTHVRRPRGTGGRTDRSSVILWRDSRLCAAPACFRADVRRRNGSERCGRVPPFPASNSDPSRRSDIRYSWYASSRRTLSVETDPRGFTTYASPWGCSGRLSSLAESPKDASRFSADDWPSPRPPPTPSGGKFLHVARPATGAVSFAGGRLRRIRQPRTMLWAARGHGDRAIYEIPDKVNKHCRTPRLSRRAAPASDRQVGPEKTSAAAPRHVGPGLAVGTSGTMVAVR